MLHEAGRQQVDELRPRDVEVRAERGDLLRPRRHGIPGGDAGAGPAQGLVALREGAAVLAWKGRAGRKDAAQHPVDVGPADGGTALDHGEAVRHEDERREAQAELFCRVERRAVQPDALALTRGDRHLRIDGSACLGALEPHPRRLIAEANETGLRARPRGEPLRADVQRLEEVRLTDAVRADHDDEAFAKLEIERGVRAKAPERDPRDDQPASLIGMIR